MTCGVNLKSLRRICRTPSESARKSEWLCVCVCLCVCVSVYLCVCVLPGRIYRLAAKDQEDFDQWMHAIRAAMRDAQARMKLSLQKSKCELLVKKTAEIYSSQAVQMLVGALIVVNFGLSIFEAETRLERR